MFQIRYRYIPINFISSRRFWSKAYSILIPNADFLKMHPNNNDPHSNNCAQNIIYALSLLYNFHPTTFRIRNLINNHDNLPSYTAKKWLNILKSLDIQLKQIQHSASLDQAKHLYPNCIFIDGLIRQPQTATNYRKNLKCLGNTKRYRFTAQFFKYGRNQDNGHKTILLKNVRYHQRIVTRHLWINVTQRIYRLGKLKRHDRLTFNARVSKYYKGVEGQYFDYHLIYPTHLHLFRYKISIKNVINRGRQSFSGTFRNFRTPKGRQVRMNRIHWHHHRILGTYWINCANRLRQYPDLSKGDRFTFMSRIKIIHSTYTFTYPTQVKRISK